MRYCFSRQVVYVRISFSNKSYFILISFVSGGSCREVLQFLELSKFIRFFLSKNAVIDTEALSRVNAMFQTTNVTHAID